MHVLLKSSKHRYGVQMKLQHTPGLWSSGCGPRWRACRAGGGSSGCCAAQRLPNLPLPAHRVPQKLFNPYAQHSNVLGLREAHPTMLIVRCCRAPKRSGRLPSSATTSLLGFPAVCYAFWHLGARHRTRSGRRFVIRHHLLAARTEHLQAGRKLSECMAVSIYITTFQAKILR